MNMHDQALDYRAFLEAKVRFSGLGTVPFCAVKLGRRGLGIELNAAYHRDAIWYCQQAEAQRATPSLFDLEEAA